MLYRSLGSAPHECYPGSTVLPHPCTSSTQSRQPTHQGRLDVAGGVPVHTCEHFVCNSTAPSLPRRKPAYLRLASAVNRAFYESHQQAGLSFVIPLSLLRAANASFHVSQAGWATKYGKPSGRPITDASAAQRGYCALNSEEVAAWYEARYGAIRHKPDFPTKRS